MRAGRAAISNSFVSVFFFFFFLVVLVLEVHSLIEDAGYDSYLNYDNREFDFFGFCGDDNWALFMNLGANFIN